MRYENTSSENTEVLSKRQYHYQQSYSSSNNPRNTTPKPKYQTKIPTKILDNNSVPWKVAVVSERRRVNGQDTVLIVNVAYATRSMCQYRCNLCNTRIPRALVEDILSPNTWLYMQHLCAHRHTPHFLPNKLKYIQSMRHSMQHWCAHQHTPQFYYNTN